MLTICCLGYCDDSQWALTRRATRNGLRNARLLAVRPSSGTLRAVRVSMPKFRRDETGYSQPEACHAMPCQRHGLLRAFFFLAVAELLLMSSLID